MRGGNMPSVDMPMPQEPKQPDFRVPSQMPGAMGGGFDHGITGNLSDIQQMPYRYGDQGGIQQMPYRGGTPTLTEFGQGLEALKKAQESRRDMSTGGLMNEETRRMMNMLQGY
jgi:hypothetical protein